MDTGTEGPTPNLVLQELRLSRGWGRPRLATEMHKFCISRSWPSPGKENLQKQIYRLESGRVREPEEFYAQLYCAYFDRSANDLFGGAETSRASGAYSVRNHRFLPVFLGSTAVTALFNSTNAVDCPEQWTACRRIELDGTTLFGWPTGVVVLHTVDELRPDCVAEIAVKRRAIYQTEIETLCCELRSRGSAPLSEPYVLSAYWVDRIPHDGIRRDAALKLLCMPRVLTNRDDVKNSDDSFARASLIEQSHLRDGFDHSAIVDFSIKGISDAFASWSGVVYSANSADRAVAESELVACELSVQSAWAYCDFIRAEVEAGRDPDVPPEYGWRYLRRVRSRLTTERPQETSQERLMREAIVDTSGLERRLSLAIEALKDCER